VIEPAAHVRSHRGNVCILASSVRLSAFQTSSMHIFEGLQDLLARMDASRACVRGIRSATLSSTLPLRFAARREHHTAVGPSGLPILMDTFVRSHNPRWSACESEAGRGVSSEFVLAATCASHRARTRDWANPKSGGTASGVAVRNAPTLVGVAARSEIVLGANDFDGDTRNDTERQPGTSGAELVACDVLARGSPRSIGVPLRRRRISSTKSRCQAPNTLLDALTSFQTALMWPESSSASKLS